MTHRVTVTREGVVSVTHDPMDPAQQALGGLAYAGGGQVLGGLAYAGGTQALTASQQDQSINPAMPHLLDTMTHVANGMLANGNTHRRDPQYIADKAFDIATALHSRYHTGTSLPRDGDE